jgi:hypothetical protein
MRRTLTFLLATIGAVALAAGLGCSSGSGGGYEGQLRCTATAGCEICEGTTCYPYYCDASAQCPSGYTCTASGRCGAVAGDGGGSGDVECDATGCVVCTATATGRDCQAYVCDTARPCPADFTCVNGSCAPDGGSDCATECCANADCQEGFVCSLQGVCVERPRPPADECDGDTPCPAGRVCESGRCVAPPPECAADADCGAGRACEGGTCVTRDFPVRPSDRCVIAGDCGPEGTCLDGACHFPCGDDDACPVTQECAGTLCVDRTASPGECVLGTDCPVEGSRCIDGTCRPACAAAADCARHERCDTARGLCEPDPRPIFECLSNGDCAGDRDCVDGRCLAVCGTDGGCPAGQACEGGWCLPQATCFDAGGCEAGEVCIDGACGTL